MITLYSISQQTLLDSGRRAGERQHENLILTESRENNVKSHKGLQE